MGIRATVIAGLVVSGALLVVGSTRGVASATGTTTARCNHHRGVCGTLTVCPGAAAVGARVTLSGSTFCGAQRGDALPHVLGLTVVFLGPKTRIGSGGGGDSYTVDGEGFRASYRIPSTYLGSQQTHT